MIFPFESTVDWIEVDACHDAFMALQRSMSSYRVKGLAISVAAGVYHPVPESSSVFMIEHLPLVEGQRCLDVGCGSGVLGLYLAQRGNTVAMGDINPQAVACTLINAASNQLLVDLRQSDLFAAFAGERFDVVTFNTPYWHRPLRAGDEILACDADGALLIRFISELPDFLAEGGRAYFTIANLSSAKVLAEIAALPGLAFKVLAVKATGFAGVERALVEAVRKP